MSAGSRRRRAPAGDTRAFEPTAGTHLHDGYVLLASFVVGASILVIEILGTRVVSPYYGVSIYVWSSLIAVTLGSLAVGYWVGGYAADRWPHVATLALEIVGGAFCVLLFTAIRRDVLVWTTPLGLKAGSLVSATVLFAPTLVVLSMTGPLAIRLVTAELAGLGRGVGWIYGVSTVGSMLGAVMTGFVLIPNFSVRALLVSVAIVLLVLGALGFLLARRPVNAAAVGAVTLLAALQSAPAATQSPDILFLAQSFYGELKVVDLGQLRMLLINGIPNGYIDRTNFESVAPYIAYSGYMPRTRPRAARALFIGLGSGSAPRALRSRYGIASTVVEIDPAVVDVARRYFDFPADMPVVIADGRRFVESTTDKYDFIVLDAFNTETHPVHLFTREFFAAVANTLTPEGIFALNMASMPYGEPGAWHAVHATLEEHFPFVRGFLGDDFPPGDTTVFTNLFLVASRAALPSPRELEGRDAHEAKVLAQMAARELGMPAEPGVGLVLTDDYNPLDDLQRHLFVVLRQDWIQKVRGVLLFDGSG